MATIRNKWLKLSPETYPEWWVANQNVKVKPYDNDRAFILLPIRSSKRMPGVSKVTARLQLYSNSFADGDYKLIKHDGDSVILYPVKPDDPETGNNTAQDIDESKYDVDIDPLRCSPNEMYIWAKAQAIKVIKKGRIPQALVQTLQFAIEMTERVEKNTPKQLGKVEESNKESLLELIQDKTISPEVRAKLQMQYDKQYNSKESNKEFKTIVREVSNE